ncbi:hypothetical protein QA597_09170 [Marinilabiliaceae bacterium ANBcel2]|nr:hypothetical protein [Marinilabiliaceae bacterium ANBcel2]
MSLSLTKFLFTVKGNLLYFLVPVIVGAMIGIFYNLLQRDVYRAEAVFYFDTLLQSHFEREQVTTSQYNYLFFFDDIIASQFSGSQHHSPNLLKSAPLFLDLIHHKYKWPAKDDSLSLYDYYKYNGTINTKKSSLNGLSNFLSRRDKATVDKQFNESSIDGSLYSFDYIEHMLYKKLQNAIYINHRFAGERFILRVELDNAHLAQQVATRSAKLLNQRYVSLRQKKAKDDYLFVSSLLDEAVENKREQLVKLYRERDRSRNLIAERVPFNFTITDERYNLYGGAAMALRELKQQAELELLDNSQSFFTVSSLKSPVLIVNPKRGTMFFSSLVIGLSVSIFMVIAKAEKE